MSDTTNIKIYGIPVDWVSELQKIGRLRLGKNSASAAAKLILGDMVTRTVCHADHHLADDTGKRRLVLRLLPEDYLYCKRSAETFGLSPSAFAADILKSHIRQHPVLSVREMNALYQSNYQLLRIGRNLNQIARQLNVGESGGVTVAEIRQLAEIINRHTETVGELLRANRERFQTSSDSPSG